MNSVNHTIFIPDTLNPQTIAMLQRQWSKIQAEETHCLILKNQNAGKFCLGMDISWAASTNADLTSATQQFAQFLEDLQQIPCITICIVDGEVRGGGLGVVAASDLAIASNNTTFQLSEGLLGFAPGVILSALQARLSAQTIKKMVFTAQCYNANAAQNLGLIDEVCDDINACEKSWLKRLKKCHKNAIRDLKYLLTEPISNESIIALLSRRLQEPETKQKLQDIAYFMENPS